MVGFDNIAQAYDDEFTNTVIAKFQRKIVWDYLAKNIESKSQLNILELNCGTAEDAIWFSSKGHKVLATDISEKMIEVAKGKSFKHSNISYSVLDISNPKTYPENMKFDLVFSNFGGFNCISPDEIQKVAPSLSKLLKPTGRFISVIMPKFCLWEFFYFILKFKFKKGIRRTNSYPIDVKIGDNIIRTWYYSPSDFKRMTSNCFKVIKKRAVGFFLPPSYLNIYFEKHPNFLGVLNRLEKLLASLGFLSNLSDHFIIEMEVKS